MELNQSSEIKQKKLKNFYLFNYISCGLQLIIICIIIYYFFNLNWENEIKENVQNFFPEDKKDDVVKGLTIYSLKYATNFSFIVGIGFIIWRIIYNLKYLKFFDGNVQKFNIYFFNIFYSMNTPIFCSLINNHDYFFYKYFVYAEISAAYLITGAIILSAILLAWFCFMNMTGPTRETGRHYEGNTLVINYEFVETADFGCGCSYISKIMGCSYKLLTIIGFIILILLTIGMNNYLIKTIVILELLLNIFNFWIIKDFQNMLKTHSQNNLI